VAPAPSQNSTGRGRMPAVASGAASAVTRSPAIGIIRPSESCRAPGAWIGTYPHTARKRLARFSTVDTPPYPVPKNLPMRARSPPACGRSEEVRDVTDDAARVHGRKIGHGVSGMRNGAITRLRQLNDRSIPDAHRAIVAQPALAFAPLGA
jgi:hypothetical protein